MDEINDAIDAMRRVKRKREELSELEKIYPNINDFNLPDRIGCADVKNLEKCKDAFTRYCPAHFVIENVRFEKQKYCPPCRWIVEYVPENGTLPEQGDALKTLVELILKQVPINGEVLARGLVEKEKVVVYYAVVMCRCPVPVFEGTDIKSPLYLLENLRL